MALIACPDCGQTISSQARTCPHCALSIDPRRTVVDYVTGEVVGIQPRPGARVAPRPLRYPTAAGVALMTLGAVLVIVGSVMPWVKLGQISVSGLESDGRITVVVGAVMLILALASRSSPWRITRILVMLGASLAVVIAVIDNSRLRDGLPGNLIGAGVGTVFIGGLLAFVGGVLRSR